MRENAIEVTNVGKMYKLYKNPKDKILDAFKLNFFKKDYYEEFWALREMNLTVAKGERIGLIGNNGAGKSTLLKLIIGNVKPTEGAIKVNGDLQALMELGTGFHPEFTGRQNIRASLAYRGLSPKEISKLEDDIIDFSELDEFIDQPIRTYSAGMNARLAFSTATSISPDILIVDEVLGAGDAYFSGKCVERMKRITEDSGATVLFVSHDLNSVMQLCERVIWIDRGTIRMQGNPIDVIKEYTAAVRKREELRLKARDLRKNKGAHSMEEDALKKLYRFITPDGKAPRGKNKIYKVGFYRGNGQEVASIDVGGPMDNGQEQDNYILADKKFMNWGEPKKDENGTYREYLDIGGKYIHAPFTFRCYEEKGLEEGYLEIWGDIKESLVVEIYQDNEYKKAGELEPQGYHQYRVQLTAEEEIEKEDKSSGEPDGKEAYDTTEVSDKFTYGNRKMKILDVLLKDDQGTSTKILEVEKSVTVEIKFTALEKVHSPVFVFCIYMPDGQCASQWISEDYGDVELLGDGCYRFQVDKLLLGKGSYVASVGIFNGLSSYSGVESESYAVIDRSIFFEIRQPITDQIEKGICIQPYKGEILNGK